MNRLWLQEHVCIRRELVVLMVLMQRGCRQAAVPISTELTTSCNGHGQIQLHS